MKIAVPTVTAPSISSVTSILVVSEEPRGSSAYRALSEEEERGGKWSEDSDVGDVDAGEEGCVEDVDVENDDAA